MPDPELKALVKQNRELIERNHELLRKLYKSMVYHRVFRIVYWVVIIGVAVGAFVFLQPYIEGLLESYSGLQETVNEARGTQGQFSQEGIKSFFGSDGSSE